MSNRNEKQTYYQILDVSLQANPEIIRTAYIRAKNAYNRDSLASYSLFDPEDSKKILDEIEEAYSILSDSEKRRKYDETHGIISSDSVYSSYHQGNHAVAAFSRDRSPTTQAEEDALQLVDPFRKSYQPPSPENTSTLSNAIRMKPGVSINLDNTAPKSYQAPKEVVTNPEMEQKLKDLRDINGASLKAMREYKGFSQEEMMDYLKISKNYLAALEEDNIAKLPANVFVRGFVIQYAKILKIDHEKTASSYMVFLRSRRPG